MIRVGDLRGELHGRRRVERLVDARNIDVGDDGVFGGNGQPVDPIYDRGHPHVLLSEIDRRPGESFAVDINFERFFGIETVPEVGFQNDVMGIFFSSLELRELLVVGKLRHLVGIGIPPGARGPDAAFFFLIHFAPAFVGDMAVAASDRHGGARRVADFIVGNVGGKVDAPDIRVALGARRHRERRQHGADHEHEAENATCTAERFFHGKMTSSLLPFRAAFKRRNGYELLPL